jgi:hypothetical protein
VAPSALIDQRTATRQDLLMDQPTIRFEVTKQKISWGAYLQDLMRPKFGGGFKSYSGRGPSVVAENEAGEKRVIETTKTIEEARDRVAAIELDFKTLSAAEWCDRYDVPASFLAGKPIR